MVFCGHCGLQLAPENTACPRCGSVTEVDLSLPVDDPHLFDPTIAISSGAPQTPRPSVYEPQHPPVTPTPPQQQQLVLRPDGTVPAFGNPGQYDPTSPISSPDRQSYSPQGKTPYSSQPNMYPSITPQSDAGYLPTQGQYGGMRAIGDMSPHSQQIPPRRRRTGRLVGLIVILIVLLLILGPMIVVSMQPQLIKRLVGQTTSNATSIVSPTVTPVVTQTVLSSSDYARMLMQEYYNDINTQNYQAAYNLWGSNFQSTNTYSSFAAGYANTRHDDLTINSTTPLSDGTVSTNITLHATEDSASGIVLSTYQGTYIIGLENGAWKFISGNFHKIA